MNTGPTDILQLAALHAIASRVFTFGRIFDAAKARDPGLDLHAAPSAPLDDPATIRREMREGEGERDD